MLVASKICKYIVPESETNSEAEAWEYFLVWVSPDGGVYCWLFEDFQARTKIKGEIINTKSDNINKLYTNSTQTIRLTAEDLSENEFDTISDITRAKIVRRYFKDKSYQNLAIVTKDFRKQKSDYRYNLDIEVQEIENSLLQ